MQQVNNAYVVWGQVVAKRENRKHMEYTILEKREIACKTVNITFEKPVTLVLKAHVIEQRYLKQENPFKKRNVVMSAHDLCTSSHPEKQRTL